MVGEKISGFAVVRTPDFARTSLINPNLSLGQKIYRGVDRFRWEDIEVAYYDKSLPPSLMPVWKEIEWDSADFSGIKLVKRYEHALKALAFRKYESEIIAIWSPELEQLKGSLRSEIELEYLGLDCFALGEWSVLLNGVYAKPDGFGSMVSHLNRNGLLASDLDCQAVFDRYVELSSREVVEPLMGGATLTNLRVFAVAH